MMGGVQLLQFHLGGGSGHPHSSSLHVPPPPLQLYWCTTVAVAVAGSHHQCRRPSSHFLTQSGTYPSSFTRMHLRSRRKSSVISLVGKEDTQLRTSVDSGEDGTEYEGADPQDLEYIRQIKRVLELLKKNRDMLFSEVRLIIMIEDPREVERLRLLGIEDPDTPTRDDLVDALDEVNEGKIPENRLALKILAEEMSQWPNLEVEPTKKKPSKSLYAKATDTGINPKVAAKRLNIDWDAAADIEDDDTNDETEVPAVLGYGALYLVSAFPVIIGVSVVLILFYNSLQ